MKNQKVPFALERVSKIRLAKMLQRMIAILVLTNTTNVIKSQLNCARIFKDLYCYNL